ncbi:MAG: T9SS type A sorting domain-containing protein, partial [Bacteroidota bacterium]
TLISETTLESNQLKGVHYGGNGSLYFINQSQSIASFDPDEGWGFLELPASMAPFSQQEDLLVFSDDNIWLATTEDVFHFDGNTWNAYQLGGCSSIINSQEKIYARGGDRIYVIENEVLTNTYSVENFPMMSSLILSGHGVDPVGNLWMAFFDWDGRNTLQQVSPEGTWITYTEEEHPAINGRPIGDFHFDDNGNVWVPRDLGGAIMFDGSNFSNPILDNLDQIEHRTVTSITSDASGKLYFSHQYGVTTLLEGEWEDLSIGIIPNPINTEDSFIEFDNDGNLWWAGSRNGVFSYTPATTTSIASGMATLSGANFSVFPNPAKKSTTLELQVQDRSLVQLALYNQMGQRLTNVHLGEFAAGTYQETINLAGLPQGIYTIQVQMNDRFSSQKLIIH